MAKTSEYLKRYKEEDEEEEIKKSYGQMLNDAWANAGFLYEYTLDWDDLKLYVSEKVGEYAGIDNIKKQKKEYLRYLQQAYRMGYKPYRKVKVDGKEMWRVLKEPETDLLVIYMAVLEKIRKAGLTPKRVSARPIWGGINYCLKDCNPTNRMGDDDLDNQSVISFDQAVITACKILKDKGYVTYWSSANYKDISYRYGHVVKDKNVAYILIDPKNLTEDLKKKLFLDGKNEFWGIAPAHAEKENPDDNNEVGKYYGIWAEITSPDMSCYEVSDELVKKAIALPPLVNKHEVVKHSKQL